MNKILGTRRASAVGAALLLLVGGSTGASAQDVAQALVHPAVQTTVQAVQTTAQVVQTAVQQAPNLQQLVATNTSAATLDEQSQCLATAVYFESRGEPVEGQLAVANVVINRAQSGRYPTDWCGVVKQKAQFSFVRHGQFPHIDAGCEAWARAQAIARIAAKNLMTELPHDVLWYHANYVAPRWRNNLTKVSQIGAHIFYRA